MGRMRWEGIAAVTDMNPDKRKLPKFFTEERSRCPKQSYQPTERWNQDERSTTCRCASKATGCGCERGILPIAVNVRREDVDRRSEEIRDTADDSACGRWLAAWNALPVCGAYKDCAT